MGPKFIKFSVLFLKKPAENTTLQSPLKNCGNGRATPFYALVDILNPLHSYRSPDSDLTVNGALIQPIPVTKKNPSIYRLSTL